MAREVKAYQPGQCPDDECEPLPDPLAEPWRTKAGNGIGLGVCDARIVWGDNYGDVAWIPIRPDDQGEADRIAARIVACHNAAFVRERAGRQTEIGTDGDGNAHR